jgi:lysophospholipase L1-like esterase
MKRGIVTAILCVLVAALLIAPTYAGRQQRTASPSRCGARAWVGAWSASPSDTETAGYGHQTLRLVITPHFGGDRVRVRLTNRFGASPVTLDAVSVGFRDSGAALVKGTSRPLTFGGQRSITMARGGDVVSDPVLLTVRPFRDLAVSIAVGAPSGPATRHYLGRQTSFVSSPGTGDQTEQVSGAPFTSTIRSWPFLARVEVLRSNRVGTVVTLGDSITDGFQGNQAPVVESPTGVDENVRYPDFLSRRLLADKSGRQFTVLNAGISGNRVLRDGDAIPRFGPSALSRLDADVLAQPGVTDVIVLEGINDIGQAPPASADQLITGLKQIVTRLQTRGVNVLLGTLTPAGGTIVPTYGSAEANATRKKVNHWIRARSGADGVIDFDAAVRDRRDRSRLAEPYDSSDHLHPSTAGYDAMAKAIDLRAFRGNGCTGRASSARPGGPGRAVEPDSRWSAVGVM